MLLALGVVLARRSVGGSAFGVNLAGAPGSVVSRAVPDFTLTLYDGSSLRMSDLRGRGVVLNFWASWCVPCRDEAPLLARLAREYEPRSVTFVGLALWDADGDARAFIERYGVGYPSAPDLGGKVAIELGLSGVPETYFVRADGVLSRRWVGPIGEEQLRTYTQEIVP